MTERRVALLAALILSSAAVAELTLRDVPSPGLQIAVALLVCAPVAFIAHRLWIPLGAAAVGFAVLGLAEAEPQATAMVLPLLGCLFLAGLRLPLARARLALALILVSVLLETITAEELSDSAYVAAVFVLPPWLAGRLMRSRREQVSELERVSRELSEETGRAARLAAEAERGRLARELHDVLSHGVSLMVLQAGAGARIVHHDPDEARRTFRSIAGTGRSALAELAETVEEAEPPARIDEGLQRLAAGARAAGVEVDLRVRGEVSTLPGGLRLVVHRLVQEALTNAVKHGGGRPVVASVERSEHEVDVRVHSDGGGAAAPAGRGGRGLIGMRERVTAYAGTFEAGPLPGGAFRVEARLPIPGRTAAGT